MASVVESSESKLEERSQPQLALPSPRATLTKKMTRSQISQASKPFSAYPVEAGGKKQKSSRPPATKKPAPTSKESQPGAEVQPKDKEVLTKILEELKSFPMHETTHYPTPTFGEPIVLKIPVVYEVTSPTAPQTSFWASQPTSPKAFGEGSCKYPQLVVSKTVFPRPPKASGVIGIPIPWPRKTASTASEFFPSISIEAATIDAVTAFGVLE